MWMSSAFLLPVLMLIAALLVVVATGNAESNVVGDPGNGGGSCPQNCGGVDIPYPFGIGAGCFAEGFEIICDDKIRGGGSVLPRLHTRQDSDYIPVLNLSVTPRLEAKVMLQVTSQCYDSDGVVNGSSFARRFKFHWTYRISTRNELYVLGCNTLAYTESNGTRYNRYANYAGCMSFSNDLSSARDGVCDSVGCCHVQIPANHTFNTIHIIDSHNGIWSHRDQEFCPCDYAFIVEKGSYTFAVSDLTSMPLQKTMPVILDGAIRDNSESCAQAKNKPEYACRSNHSDCFDSDNGPGYICNCTQGYEGNPYLRGNGECSNINECKLNYTCYGTCTDTDGSYECKCPLGYDGEPKKKPCKLKRSTKMAIGTVLGTSVFIIALLAVVITFQKRQIFRKNGGNKLKNVDSLMFFTEREVKKITRNYRRPLGAGAFGQVYQGELLDKDRTKVAVKRSATAVTNVDEFVKEVEIQSRMIHKNILRLKGCCLEVKCPVLVYEFAANGNLGDMIHGKDGREKAPFPLEQRLDIAIGSAEGLAYMHTYIDDIIQHGDVKPDNILLDEKFVPRLSDFGLSILLAEGKQYVSNVKGCIGYMDPSLPVTKRLTPANDVYSFGVVLLELIARRPIEPRQYFEECGLVSEFRRAYEEDSRTGEQGNNRHRLLDEDIATQEDIPVLEGVVRLAIECIGENRPDMTEVARRLAMLKKEWKHGMTSSQVTGTPNRISVPPSPSDKLPLLNP